jgi:ubiquinone/menaquinone biosynthesis C-methylase UbiE
VSPSLYTEQYFLTACEGYDEFLASEGAHLSRRLTQAFKVAAVTAGMKVIDVGCGRGEIVRHCSALGADAYGVDYAPVAVHLARRALAHQEQRPGQTGLAQADAKRLPFPDNFFDRALVFDVVEHLQPWELERAYGEIRRVLKPGGMIVIHTAPNRWYDVYAYPVVRLVRRLTGDGANYPANPRALNVAANVDVHVNEQDMLGLRRGLARAGFRRMKVWLDSPPQRRRENALFAALRFVAFEWPPFRWFFERELFAVGVKTGNERPSLR